MICYNLDGIARNCKDILFSIDITSIYRMNKEKDGIHMHLSHYIKLVYLPQVNLQSGELDSLEVRLQFTHLELGKIPSAKWVPLFGQKDLLPQLTTGLGSQLTQMHQQWNEAGFSPVRFSIDITSMLVHSAGSFQLILDTIRHELISPAYLELEIDENVFSDSFLDLMEPLYHLRRLGGRVCLNIQTEEQLETTDLKHLPIDKIKLGKVLSQNATEIHGLHPIISKAKELSITVAAAGVETEEQWIVLKGMGVETAQGCYFSGLLTDEEVVQHGFLKGVMEHIQ